MEYGLIGEKLGHSFSKPIHEELADYTYDIMPLTKDEFHEFMKARDFKAINVTIPYKKDVIPYLDCMDDNARMIGAVNTIVNKNGTLTGYNTDFSGFLYMLKHNNIHVENKKVIVLGNGGASQAIIAVMNTLLAKEVIVVDVVKSQGAITYEECLRDHLDAAIIINTSPVGMYPNIDNTPIDLTHFSKCEAVIDVIYNPTKTKLTLQGQSLGMTAITGLEMLVAQAKYAVEIFLDKKIEDTVIDPLYKKILVEINSQHG